MEKQSVVILGAGVWGRLLAYRLSQRLPKVRVKVYAGPGAAPESSSWSFREKDLSPENLQWIRPIISCSWRGHRFRSESMEREFSGTYSTILPVNFERVVGKSHEIEKLASHVTVEDLLEKSSFIIDTRPDPRQRSKCVRQAVGLIVELNEAHRMDIPLVMDTYVNQKGILRHMQYFPLNARTLLVRDIRYLRDPLLNLEVREEELLWEVRKKWQIKDILHHESESVAIPSGKIAPWNDGRIISLGGILNPVTGESFADVVKLVDLMVDTSFRPGELRAVIHQYQSERERRKRLSRFLVKMIYHSPQSSHRLQLLDYLFRLPEHSVGKFLEGTMGVWDLGRSMIGHSPLPLVKALLLHPGQAGLSN